MTTDDKIRDEKRQYDINREAAKISAFTSDKIDKYEYLAIQKILPTNQSQVIEHAKLTNFSLGKASIKQTKQYVDDIKTLNPSNKIHELKQIESTFQKKKKRKERKKQLNDLSIKLKNHASAE